MNALAELAERYGIQAAFVDARGHTRNTSAETRRALLAAMGVAAEDDTQAAATLKILDSEDWDRVLPPVIVACPGNDMAVSVQLPAITGLITWRIELEDGGTRQGELRFADLVLEQTQASGGVLRERRRFPVAADLPFGYHSLRVDPGGGETSLIITPGRCWLPPRTQRGERLWGVSAQLYLLQSADNWGIGDFGDLRRLAQMLVSREVDVVGLNPLHAMFLDDPEHASPYSPASRLLLNVLYIDVAALLATSDCPRARKQVDSPEFRRLLRHCREAKLLDYSGVAALKIPVLRLLFDAAQADTDASGWRAFQTFRDERGDLLQRGCCYLALREMFAAQSPAAGDWHSWPMEYRDPQSAEVAAFALAQQARVTFHAWLQFIADSQLAAAAAAAQSMAVGLYRDLAVGAARSGAETWANQVAVVADAQVGAPPDIYNPAGQDWGLPPFHPRALRQEAYRSFIDLVRTNMRHAGGLRIDHVMALQQLYWVPKDENPSRGAYIRYPLDDLVGILALESQRQHCLVVGEDLGTVPAGFRERMAAANILSYRVLFFEKDDNGFIAPDRYPELALAVAGSHDLPPLRAWWEAGDLELKEQLHLFPSAEDAQDIWQERKHDRQKLLEALQDAGLAGDDTLSGALLNRAVHAYLARSNCALALVQLDDVTDEATPVNVPTTSDEYPNWRRRLSLTLEQLAGDAAFAAICEVFRRERARASS